MGVPRKTDPRLSFDAYRYYLSAIYLLLEREYGSDPIQLSALSQAINRRPAYQGIEPLTYARPDRLAALIKNAWQTEVALKLPRLLEVEDEEFAALSIHWGTSQLYYAVYCAASAWLEAMSGANSPRTHREALDKLAKYATTEAMFPLPWGAACHSYTPVAYSGETAGYQYQPRFVDHLHSPDLSTALDMVCLFLKTTRDKDLALRVATWKKKTNRERILRPELRRLDSILQPTTVFDFLWFLRKRATYEDAELFLVGSTLEDDAVGYFDNLCRIGRASLLLFEKLLAKAYGRDNMERLARDFMSKSRYGKKTVGERIPYW